MADYPALDLTFRPGPDGLLEDLLYAALDDFQPLAVHEHDDGDGWRVFFRSAAMRDAAAAALAGVGGGGLTAIVAVEVPDEDWARRSQANLTAITVGCITVAPPWDAVASMPDDAPRTAPLRDPRSLIPDPDAQIMIVIDPSMGFGTGHHQTTRLCLSLLQSLDLTGRRLTDVGTGSGVLAIAGWRLGAIAVVAVDNDPDAIQNARENVERNGGSGVIDVRCEELSACAAPPADVVTANLTAAVLCQHTPAIVRLVAPGGAVIVSGFSPAELPEVAAAFGAREMQSAVEGEWAAALMRL